MTQSQYDELVASLDEESKEFLFKRTWLEENLERIQKDLDDIENHLNELEAKRDELTLKYKD